MSVNSYCSGTRSVIAFRALPGNVSLAPIHGAAGPIGTEMFDSHESSGTYVIRRSCQALPCFLVHF